jgi:hypothetical protein
VGSSDAAEWIRRHVDALRIETVHERPWSTVLRVETPEGVVWFKANAPELRYEAALTALLAERRPDCVLTPLALDPDRGWLLLPDGGTTLRAIVERERSLERWLDVLPLYASVQRDLARDVERLLAAGVPDLRLAQLPGRFEQFVSVLPPEEHDRWRARLPEIAGLCKSLAQFGIQETIQHDDLHDAQVYVRDGRYLLLDWGDACVSHPFFTLSVTLEGVIAWGLDDVEGSVDAAPYLAAYLEPYGGPELAEAAALATRLGWICRAVNGHVPGELEPTLRRLAMFERGTAATAPRDAPSS